MGPRPRSRDSGAAPQSDTQTRLAAGLRESRERGEPVLVTLRVPPVGPGCWLGVLDVPVFAWSAPGRARFACAGVAGTPVTLDPFDEERCLAAADAATRAFRLSDVSADPTLAPRLRAFAGASFSARTDDSGPWRGWGRGLAVVPRWYYEERESGATFAMLALPGDPPRRDPALVAEGVRALGALSQPRDTVTRHAPVDTVGTDADAWGRGVTRALDHISSGAASKLVLARSLRVTFSGPVNPHALFDRLAESAESIVFAVERKGSCFLGASPETLVRRVGETVESDALAGTGVPQRPLPPPDIPLEDAKLTREHRLVVDALLARLAPLCRQIDAPSRPRTRTCLRVEHLYTPVRGRLSEPVHVLELARRLHPTPAVAGKPVDEALRWIDANEDSSRGWYAGPIGWFDAQGDGEFAVALRCALVRGNDALLYAGAGLVPGSDPREEYDETALKLRTMLDALGVPR
jgi:isochorismate synthase